MGLFTTKRIVDGQLVKMPTITYGFRMKPVEGWPTVRRYKRQQKKLAKYSQANLPPLPTSGVQLPSPLASRRKGY
jgi:hypothetical protein